MPPRMDLSASPRGSPVPAPAAHPHSGQRCGCAAGASPLPCAARAAMRPRQPLPRTRCCVLVDGVPHFRKCGTPSTSTQHPRNTMGPVSWAPSGASGPSKLSRDAWAQDVSRMTARAHRGHMAAGMDSNKERRHQTARGQRRRGSGGGTPLLGSMCWQGAKDGVGHASWVCALQLPLQLPPSASALLSEPPALLSLSASTRQWSVS